MHLSGGGYWWWERLGLCGGRLYTGNLCTFCSVLLWIWKINWERKKSTAGEKEQEGKGQIMVTEDRTGVSVNLCWGPKFWMASTFSSLCSLFLSCPTGLQWPGILAWGSLILPIFYLSRLGVLPAKTELNTPSPSPAFSQGHPGTHSPGSHVWVSGLPP